MAMRVPSGFGGFPAYKPAPCRKSGRALASHKKVGVRGSEREEEGPEPPSPTFHPDYQRYVMRTKNVFAVYGSLAYPV